MSRFLPDVNVLVALTLRNHIHSVAANRWYQQENRPTLQVCRLTQLSLLRFLTTAGTAGVEVLSNDAAWNFYSTLIVQRNITFCHEPDGMSESFGTFARFGKPAPKLWADAYLAAFAVAADFRLVTFDRALARMAPKAIALRG